MILLISYIVIAALVAGVVYTFASRARYMEDEVLANSLIGGLLGAVWPVTALFALLAVLALIGARIVGPKVHALADALEEFRKTG